MEMGSDRVLPSQRRSGAIQSVAAMSKICLGLGERRTPIAGALDGRGGTIGRDVGERNPAGWDDLAVSLLLLGEPGCYTFCREGSGTYYRAILFHHTHTHARWKMSVP